MMSWSLHQGLYFLNDSVSGHGLFLNLNLHQILGKIIYNMTIFGKTNFFTLLAYTIEWCCLKFIMAPKQP